MSSVILELLKIMGQAEWLVISEEIFFSGVSSLDTALGYAHGLGSAGVSPGVTSYTGAGTRPFEVWSLAHIAGGVPELPPLVS